MPAEPDPIDTDLRRAHRARGLPAEAACAICGETNPEMLRRVKRSLLEKHHIAGATDKSLTVVLCLNHHAMQSFGQRGAGIELDEDPEREFLERVVNLLRGLAVFFEQLAQALADWANDLVGEISRLDSDSPTWRGLGPATS